MRLTVMPQDQQFEQAASELAGRLGLAFSGTEAPAADLVLLVGERLELHEARAQSAPVTVEFKSRRASPLLLRATLAGRPGVRVIDATAGLGQDAFDVANAGCTVELIERSPVVAALLEDGIDRARQQQETREAAGRMRLHQGEALELLEQLAPAEVVYLDPMYPVSGREGRKGKEMRLLRQLLGSDSDSAQLLAAARRCATRRVTVKRPLRASPLANERPSGSLRGTTVRFDLYAGSE